MNTGSLFGFVKTTILGSGSRCWKATIYFFLSVVSDNDIFVPKREGLDDIVLLSPLCIELTLDFFIVWRRRVRSLYYMRNKALAIQRCAMFFDARTRAIIARLWDRSSLRYPMTVHGGKDVQQVLVNVASFGRSSSSDVAYVSGDAWLPLRHADASRLYDVTRSFCISLPFHALSSPLTPSPGCAPCNLQIPSEYASIINYVGGQRQNAQRCDRNENSTNTCRHLERVFLTNAHVGVLQLINYRNRRGNHINIIKITEID